MKNWTTKEVDAIRDGVAAGKSHADIAVKIGRSTGAVRSKASLVGAIRSRLWSKDQEQMLIDAYTEAGTNGVIDLVALAAKIGRSKPNICRKAKQMGLETSVNRRKVEQRKDRRKFGGDDDKYRKHVSERMKKWLKENGHPRGALGMKHTPQTLEVISKKSREQAASMTPERQAEINMKIMKTRVKNGTDVQNKPHGSWKAAWHEIGGEKNYYRSNWEANYAKYLEWLKSNNQIKDWFHEPKTFWFDGIKRGSVSYLPDFKVIENDGREVYHEVKGWMDDRSRVKIARMGKYHPDVPLVVINGKAYMEIRRKVSVLVPGWQDLARDKKGL